MSTVAKVCVGDSLYVFYTSSLGDLSYLSLRILFNIIFSQQLGLNIILV